MGADIRTSDAWTEFSRTTSRWGQVTLTVGMLLSLSGPAWLMFTLDLDTSAVVQAFVAVVSVFGVFAIVEPITYYPILGAPSMYQAFMIGNVSNKLLPSALVAQNTIGAEPGSPKSQLSAVAAICGAATVHLVSLFLLVGVLGTWLVTVIPANVAGTVQAYILPSIMGAVLVQAIITQKSVSIAVFAVGVASVVVFVAVPTLPALSKFATPLIVLVTILLAWIWHRRSSDQALPNQSF